MSDVANASVAPETEVESQESRESISKVADLMLRIRTNRESGNPLWYRGQANSAWRLEPKLARERGYLKNEVAMLKHFQQDAAPRLREKPESQWEWIFLAQHYGLPTRLLDWSENPLIGLYFAVETNDADMDEPVDGALFELNPDSLNAETTGDTSPEVVMFGHDTHLEDYLPGNTTKSRMGPVAAIAGRSFDRIIAQSGTFTITHKDHVLDEGNPNFGLNKIIIPKADKDFIREELADLNIRASTVYPDLDHLAAYVMGRHVR